MSLFKQNITLLFFPRWQDLSPILFFFLCSFPHVLKSNHRFCIGKKEEVEIVIRIHYLKLVTKGFRMELPYETG